MKCDKCLMNKMQNYFTFILSVVFHFWCKWNYFSDTNKLVSPL